MTSPTTSAPQNARLVAVRLKEQFSRLARARRSSATSDPSWMTNKPRVIEVTGVLVIYDPHLKPLTILRVVHGSRDLGRVELGK